ncbi:MAG TPA: hypothetical protein VFA59_17045 [Vicinamibacterales bacterium]|nr:hypothetical protein [Vicinamibacterales bacterium]
MKTYDLQKPRIAIAVTAIVAAFAWVMRGLLEGFGLWIAAAGSHLFRYLGYR